MTDSDISGDTRRTLHDQDDGDHGGNNRRVIFRGHWVRIMAHDGERAAGGDTGGLMYEWARHRFPDSSQSHRFDDRQPSLA